jgi:isocitrate/isopropylmalate dehydrogenase
MPYWDERVEEMAKNYPDIRWDKQHIDIPVRPLRAAAGAF